MNNMPHLARQCMNITVRKTIASIVIFAFLWLTIQPPSQVFAQESPRLPSPGVRVGLSPEYNPPVFKGVTVHPDNPFKFDFILDKGDRQTGDTELKQESQKLVKYFLSSITTPEKDLWVNLSPYEKNRIVPESFGQTDMGRDLLAQDYLLKQITSSLMYPEEELGKRFWRRIYEEATKQGVANVPVNTFNKVWIVPEHAKVYEHGNTAFIVKSRLKVMLEQDYLAQEKNVRQPGDMMKSCPQAGCQASDPMNAKAMPAGRQATQRNPPNALGSAIVREIVIPELEKEVNEGKNFAPLRQVYQSLILALWFKKRMKDSVLGRKYMDQNKVMGIDIEDKDSKQKIYEQYLKAFKKGVYNYIKQETDPLTQQVIPRKYFSGGAEMDRAMRTTEFYDKLSNDDKAMLNIVSGLVRMVVNLAGSPSLTPQEKLYNNRLKTVFDNIGKYGFISRRKAKELGLNIFVGADKQQTDRLGAFIALVKEFMGKKKYDLENAVSRVFKDYDDYLNRVIEDLFNVGNLSKSPIGILVERTEPSFIREVAINSKNIIEERLKSGVLVLMSTDKNEREIRDQTKYVDDGHAYGFDQVPLEQVEAIFVPEGLYSTVRRIVPVTMLNKLIKVKGEIVPPYREFLENQIKMPDWRSSIFDYLKRNNRTRTLMLHGMRLPTRDEVNNEVEKNVTMDEMRGSAQLRELDQAMNTNKTLTLKALNDELNELPGIKSRLDQLEGAASINDVYRVFRYGDYSMLDTFGTTDEREIGQFLLRSDVLVLPFKIRRIGFLDKERITFIKDQIIE